MSVEIGVGPRHRGATRLVYILVVSLGAVLILAGAYMMSKEVGRWAPEVCLALGVAVSAPGVLSYLYRRYLFDEIKTELQQPADDFKVAAVDIVRKAVDEVIPAYREEIALLSSVRKAGLHGLYSARPRALEAFLPFIEEEEQEFVVVASSMLGLLQKRDNEYRSIRKVLSEKIDAGVSARFLLTHPVIADLRARQENRKFTEIGTEIVDSLAILIDDWNVSEDAIRLYQGTPTCFGLKTSSASLLNCYPYMREAFGAPTMIAKKGGYLYDHFSMHHFGAWNSVMAKEVPNLDELRDQLDEFAEDVRKLLSLKPDSRN